MALALEQDGLRKKKEKKKKRQADSYSDH